MKRAIIITRIAGILLTAITVLLVLAPAALAKTYVITDGDRAVTYTASDPAGTGVTTEPDDTGATRDENSAAGPAARVLLRCRGEEIALTSEGENVGQLLARVGIDLTEEDVVSHDLAQPVTDGMELRVDTVVIRTEVYTAPLPYGSSRCMDASLTEGTEEVLIQGQDGQLQYTADVTYVNGQETHREILREDMVLAPVTEIIAQGTGKPEFEHETGEMPVIKDGYILMPSGEMLTYHKKDYVTATGYTHTDAGCDMVTSTGTIVRYGTVAVDPRFIPYGTRMLIVSHDGQRFYGIATAEDCGGAIKRDKMDLYFPTYQECIEFGRRRCTIYFLD